MTEQQSQEWDASYERKDNHLFYPHEDVIRFISKYVRKRIGFDAYIDQKTYSDTTKVLDFGCGIGRHMIFLDDFGLKAYGFDLSAAAIAGARENFRKHAKPHLADHVVQASILDLPYADGEFSHMLSHGVLDSMPFDVASQGMIELYRCLTPGGLVYFDVVATEDDTFPNQGEMEVVVESQHEEGTIQSYFDEDRISEMLQGKFRVVELLKISKSDRVGNGLLLMWPARE